jgi:hypothetical protein
VERHVLNDVQTAREETGKQLLERINDMVG